MSDDKAIPEMTSYEQVADFWDTHSLADYWDETEPAEFEIDATARRRYLVALDPELLERVRQLARTRGLTTESLVNLFIEQRLQQVDARP
jgi:predicted DNA binding CopG/RHH family protein